MQNSCYNITNVLNLKYKYNIKSCLGNFAGLGCNFCGENYYTWMDCNVYCSPAPGHYNSCNPQTGEKVCVTGKTGVNCDICTTDYYSKNCIIHCIPVIGNYSCNPKSGEKDCVNGKIGLHCSSCKKDRVLGQDCDAGV